MRIGVLFGYALHGSGSCVYVQELIQALCQLGHDCTLICHEPEASSIERLVPDVERTSWGMRGKGTVADGTLTVRAIGLAEIPVTYPRPEIRNGTILSEMSRAASDEYVDTLLGHLIDAHDECRFDLMLVNHAGLLVDVADRYRAVTGTPFRVVVHGTDLHYGLSRSEELRTRVGNALKQADTLVALNKSAHHRLRAVLPECEQVRCVQIPPGTDTERFALTGRKDEYVVYVGRLSLDKGLHCLLAAWPIIAASNPGVELRIAGDGCDAERLRRGWEWLRQGDRTRFRDACVPRGDDAHGRATFAKQLVPLDSFLAGQGAAYDWLCVNARDTVHFMGPLQRPDVARLVCNARLMVFPSLIPETHPLAVCEALSAGTPVVGTNVAGIRWILKRVEEFVPALKSRMRVSPEATVFASGLARQAIALLRSPPKPTVMAHASSFVSKHFSWSSCATELVAGMADTVGTLRDSETSTEVGV